MKKRTILMFLMVIMAIPVMAQPGGKTKKEKIEELKIAFITRELDLSSEEAQEFWPVYNEMSDKLKTEKKKQKGITRDLRESQDSYSEADIKKKSGALMDSRIRQAELQKEYHNKIAGIVGYKKAIKLLSLEQRFKRELLNRLNKDQNKGGGGGRTPGGPRSDINEY